MDGASQNGKREVERVPQNHDDNRQGDACYGAGGIQNHQSQLVHNRSNGGGSDPQTEETGIGEEIADEARKAIDIPQAQTEPHRPVPVVAGKKQGQEDTQSQAAPPDVKERRVEQDGGGGKPEVPGNEQDAAPKDEQQAQFLHPGMEIGVLHHSQEIGEAQMDHP